MPSAYIREAVAREVERFSSDRGIRIVDVSCSDGLLLRGLFERGYRNLSGTLYGDQNDWEYKPADGEFDFFTVVPHADVLGRIPLEEGAFDVVINTELLEHLENHRQALSELSRLVKPGGILILETPNIMRLQSRLNFLLTGFHKPRTLFPPYDKPLSHHLYFHVFPIHLPVLDYFLHQHGLRLRRVLWNRWKVLPVLLALVLSPLMVLFEWVVLLREKMLTWPYKWHLFKLQLHPAVLVCNVLVLTYTKLDESRAAPRDG